MGHRIIKITTNHTMSIHVIVVPNNRIGSSKRRLRYLYRIGGITCLSGNESELGAGSETSDIHLLFQHLKYAYQPEGPVGPVGPVIPRIPCAPVAPVTPRCPISPCAPVAPVTPRCPISPCAPVAPVAPR